MAGSPYTYEEMKRRQMEENRKFVVPPDVNAPEDAEVPLPEGSIVPDTTAADTTGIDPSVLNAAAIDDSTTVPPPAGAAPGTQPKRVPKGSTVDPGKRAVVMNALRNSDDAVPYYVKNLRHDYGVSPSFKASDKEIIRATYEESKSRMPDLKFDEYIKAVQDEYKDRVEKSLLNQARQDYPDYKDDADLIDKMYQHKIAKDETSPLTWADKAQIVARRYPELHDAPGEPEAQLRTVYDKVKAADKDGKVGSFDDWMHEQMAPTLGENVLHLGSGIVRGLWDQIKSVGTLGKEVTSPSQLRNDVVAAMGGDEKAKERLKQAAMGGVNVGAIAASILTGGAVTGAETALGAAKTAPLLTGALEGATGGLVQGAGSAALEGQGLGGIAQQAANTAGLGMALGAAGGAKAGLAAKAETAANAGEMEATHQAAMRAMDEKAASDASVQKNLDAAEAARIAEINKGGSLAPSKYAAALEKFADEHHITIAEARRAIESEDALAHMPKTSVVAEMTYMRQLASDAADAQAAETSKAVQPPEGETSTPPTQGETPAPTGPLPQDVTDQLRTALKTGRDAAKQQAKLYKAERGSRAARAAKANEAAGGGLAGSQAELGALKGELPKVQWEAIKGTLTQQNIDALYNAINNSDMSFYSQRTAKNGLNRLLGIDSEGPPRPSEIAVMKRVFGDAFVDDLLPEKTLREKMGDFIRLTLATPRALMTVHGFSAFGRQGFNLIGTPEWWGNIAPVAKMWGNEKYWRATMDEIEGRPTYGKMLDAGVKFNELIAGETGESGAESLLDLLPKKGKLGAMGKFYRMNKRSFVGGVNKLRADSFDRVYNNMKQAGIPVDDPKYLDAIGDLVNNSTGRGKLAKTMGVNKAAELLGQVMFSPRLTSSRFRNFLPNYYLEKPMPVAVEAARQNISAVAAAGAILSLLSLGGWKVGTDWRSADFGKAKKGNTRIDLFAGHAQVARLIGQIASGQTVSSTTGKVTDLRSGKYGQKTALDVMQQFFENKEAPVPSLLVLLAKKYSNELGPDKRPINLGKEMFDRSLPIPFTAVVHAAADVQNDPLTLGGLAVGAQAGAGVESYGPGDLVSAPPLSFKSGGMNVVVPSQFQSQFIDEIAAADKRATARGLALVQTPQGKAQSDAETQKLTMDLVKSERAKVLYRWTRANSEVLGQHHREGSNVTLTKTPEQAGAEALGGKQ